MNEKHNNCIFVTNSYNMTSAELKLDIINKIANIKEEHIIEDIKTLLDFELDKNVYSLTEMQKSRLEEAKTDYIMTEAEANKDIEQWLSEK